MWVARDQTQLMPEYEVGQNLDTLDKTRTNFSVVEQL